MCAISYLGIYFKTASGAHMDEVVIYIVSHTDTIAEMRTKYICLLSQSSLICLWKLLCTRDLLISQGKNVEKDNLLHWERKSLKDFRTPTWQGLFLP